jgi:SHS2 domain-containing protein
LEEIIYYKDVYRLLLTPKIVQIEWEGEDERFFLLAHMKGDAIDSRKNTISTDVKAVSYHRLKIIQTPKGWNATVVLDV